MLAKRKKRIFHVFIHPFVHTITFVSLFYLVMKTSVKCNPSRTTSAKSRCCVKGKICQKQEEKKNKVIIICVEKKIRKNRVAFQRCFQRNYNFILFILHIYFFSFRFHLVFFSVDDHFYRVPPHNSMCTQFLVPCLSFAFAAFFLHFYFP